jgi:hypothetical protein
MQEKDYWSTFRKHLVSRVYAWKINDAYAAGIPDWWGSGRHQDLWVENKRIFRDAAQPPVMLDLTDVKKYLSFRQQDWLVHRHDEGRHVGVLVFSRIGHVYFPGLTWQERMSRLDFIQQAESYKDVAERLINIMGELK